MKRFSLALLGLAILSASLTISAGVNTWTGIGPEGGTVSKVVFHPTNPDTLFALTSSGAYRSVNSGESWQRVLTPALAGIDYGDLEIDPANPARVYFVGGGGRPMVSDDGGVTFSQLTALPTSAGDAANVEVSADGAIVYLAGYDHVYRSTDHGSTWSTRGQLPGVTHPIDGFLIDPADTNTLYALAQTTLPNHGLFLSEDGGATWQLLEDSTTSNHIQTFAVSGSPRRLWTARLDNIYVSIDQGRHSTPVAFNKPALAITVDPANANKIYATDISGKVYRSDDAGLHWNDITANQLVEQAYGIYRHPQRAAEIYVSGISGLARTTNAGANWSLRQSGIRTARVYSMSANATDGRIYLSSTAGGIQFLQSGADAVSEVNNAALGQTLAQVTGFFAGVPLTDSILAQEGTPGRLYASFPNDVLRSTDGGDTWHPLNFPAPNGSLLIWSFASSPRAPDVIFAADNNGVMRSVDAGDHWSSATAGLPANAVMNVVVAARSDESFVYGSLYLPNPVPGQSPLGQGVYRWNQAATQWVAANSGITNARIYDLAVHATAPQVALAVTGTSIMKTTNGGSSWAALAWDGISSNAELARVAFDPLDSRIIYAANNGRIGRSVDSGTSWETLLDLADNGTRRTTAMIADPAAPGTLVVGTAYESAFQFTVAPDLALQLKTPPTHSASGSALSYELTAQNLGPFHATGVQVNVQLPVGVTSISAEPADVCAVATSTVKCSMDVLGTGLSSPITVHATPGSTGTFAVTAAISGAQEDATSANNSVSGSTIVEMPSDLAVTASGSVAAQVGATVTYTVTVSNAGPNSASSTQLSYQLASGLSNASATTTRGTCASAASLVTCNLGDVASTESATISITATAAAVGKQDSTATVSSNTSEIAVANNTATNSTTISAASSSGGGGTSGSSSGGGGALSPEVLFALALLLLARLGRTRWPRLQSISALPG